MKYTHVPGRMQPWDEFHESPCISPERMILSPLWILCVSWCQIERAARFHLRLGILLHLHAIHDSKTWNDSDKTSMTAGNYKTSFIIPSWQVSFFLFMASSFAWKTLIAFKMIAFSFDPHSAFDKPKTLNYIEYKFCWH
jgi:hypothetical protein